MGSKRMKTMSMRYRLLAVACSLLAAAFLTGSMLRGSHAGDTPKKGARVNQSPRCDCLSAEETRRALIDEASRVWKDAPPGPPGLERSSARTISGYLAYTPAGHRHLRAMLE